MRDGRLMKTMIGMLPKCWSTDVRELVQAVKTSMDVEVDGTFAWYFRIHHSYGQVQCHI